MKNIEPESLVARDLHPSPPYYQSMAGNPLQDRLGSKTTYSGYLKIVGQQDITVIVPASGSVTTVRPHGVSSSIPFIFLYIKKDGYYSRLGFVDSTETGTTETMSNAFIDSKNFSFIINNFYFEDQRYQIRAIIFELNN